MHEKISSEEEELPFQAKLFMVMPGESRSVNT